MSDRIHREYMKRVGAALKHTRHPRQRQVLEELRAHLNEMALRSGSALSIEELVERMGPPEEYAESLTPATEYPAKPWYRRKRIWFAPVIALFLIGIGLVVQDHSHELWAKYREILGRNYSATPFFSLERARNLKPGTGPDEIRDVLGFPWKRYPGDPVLGEVTPPAADLRFAGSAQKDELVWEYTASPTPVSPYYTACNVITSASNGTIKRVDIFTVNLPHEDRSYAFRWPRSINAGSVWLGRGDSFLTISPDDPHIYVFGIFVYNDDNIDERLIRMRTRITAAWKDVPLDNFRFLFLVGPGDVAVEELDRWLETLPDDSPVYRSWGMPMMNNYPYDPNDEDMPFNIVFYKRGTIYEYPSDTFESDEELKRLRAEDQVWFVRKLLSLN